MSDAKPETRMSTLQLKLFIAGESVGTRTVIEHARRILESAVGNDYDLKVIDVLQAPALAEQDKVLATPTLIKSSPSPQRRVIGDLSNYEQVRAGLNL